MNKSITQKYTTLLFILLFIGVAVEPSINQRIVKASTDDDLVEVTTQACGIQGYGNTTVKLTREQYQNLESYLVEFRARLNQTSTREEAVPLFKDAVVELDKYGLLPKGMSVEQAGDLVTGAYLHQYISRMQRLVNKAEISNNTNQNYLCLIYGETTHTFLRNPFWEAAKIPMFLTLLIFSPIYFVLAILAIFSSIFFPPLALILFSVFTLGGLIAEIFGGITELITINPIRLFSTIELGVGDSPASGQLYTTGIAGQKNWNGSFFGGVLPRHRSIFGEIFYPGIIGFTGFSISGGIVVDSTSYYIGSALRVKINEVVS